MPRRFCAIIPGSIIAPLALLFLLSACSTFHRAETLPSVGQPPAVSQETPHGWWHARFKVVWPPEIEPDWGADLLMAHRVVEPVLLQYADRIPLWRFHRRASRDAAGHQFSFIFYSDKNTAAGVFSALQGSPLRMRLEAAGVVEAFLTDDVAAAKHSDVSDTSDAHWSEPLQKSWPLYIMGVSAMWLDLIRQFAGPGEDSLRPVEEILHQYRQIDRAISRIWREEGQHALLHHLNAIFGYEPLMIRKPMKF